ncbi:MAG TPA: SAM-dependent methyltransferase [Acidimicrobiia bacterium]|jgi:tRNA-Thr(GGU) m(6)t(6)A37 methyltransferase TsaA|nr:SAM-dependent methyltransferase [Acidimicrobiia bacterium]
MDINAEFVVRAIGVVASPRDEAIDDDWGAIEATITLHAPYGAESVRGLDAFSHIDVVFLFDRVAPDSVQTGARVPRSNPAWPEVGIFAQRAKMRPNRIAVTTCELVAVDGATVRVRGLDAIDGTPVLDVKPYMTEFGPRGETRQPSWSHELMAGYW